MTIILPRPTDNQVGVGHTCEPMSGDPELGRFDGCPVCVETYQYPISSYPATLGYVATYRCRCGHRWSTAWSDR